MRPGRLLVVAFTFPALAHAAPGAVSISVDNTLPLARPAETVAIALKDLQAFSPTLDPAKAVVKNDKGKVVLSQWVDTNGDNQPDELVFQVTLGPKQGGTFRVEEGPRARPTRADFKVYGRFVREHHDDFAWENDLVAHRVYGPALETWKPEPLVSSGVDVWCKKKGALVLNDWYLMDDYHRDRGQGGDFYAVKTSRGVGGTAVAVGEGFSPSRNFVKSRVLAQGPIRLLFELEYAPWNAGGSMVSEIKRVILDAGARFNVVESTFRVAGNGPPPRVGVAIAKHDGSTLIADKAKGIIRGWEPLFQADKSPVGNLGTAVLVDPKTVDLDKATDADQWLVLQTADTPLRYALGTAWDKSGDIPDAAAWIKAVDDAAARFATPVELRLTAGESPKR